MGSSSPHRHGCSSNAFPSGRGNSHKTPVKSRSSFLPYIWKALIPNTQAVPISWDKRRTSRSIMSETCQRNLRSKTRSLPSEVTPIPRTASNLKCYIICFKKQMCLAAKPSKRKKIKKVNLVSKPSYTVLNLKPAISSDLGEVISAVSAVTGLGTKRFPKTKGC